MKFYIKIFLIILLFTSVNIIAQDSSNLVYVDNAGQLKWTSTNENAYFFGVNYSVPFAFSYRALKNKGISHKAVIDLDVQQFKRLGINAYRIHVWDREVSDKDGNLLNNGHIELLDYLISKLIENDIYIILTPIAWWGTGWPEPDVETPGFSSFYSKIESTTDLEVLKAHLNYLKQFVNHVNSFTGKSYKDEKNIIAFEIFNEPNLPNDVEKINHYVNTTVNAIREEEVTKPIFFNISENPGKLKWEGVASSNIQGVSFQWYPTGLVKYSELHGNFLPNVFSYPVPDYTDKIKNKAKIVYEFDAADIGSSIMYSLMAHSFREAGMQWAAMFCYDPTPLAQYNSEYSTHYLNLLYTPQKALGFLIAANLFIRDKINKKEIDNTSIIMDNVLVDYEKDLSILNDDDKLYYTNSNNVIPKNINSLKHIAGYGISNIISYNGRGTYFLDKITEGIWKLEVYPDVVWINDPFGKNGLEKPVAKLLWKKHGIKINLPNLSPKFHLISEDKSKSAIADSSKIKVEPGRYFVSNDGSIKDNNFENSCIDFGMIKKYGEFITDFYSTEIKNLTPNDFYENQTGKINVDVFSKEEDTHVFVYLKKEGWRSYQKERMIRKSDFSYEYILPNELNKNGLLNYFITIEEHNKVLTFPGKINLSPQNWDFNSKKSYQLKILPVTNSPLIYSPIRDKESVIFSNIRKFVDYNFDYTFDIDGNPELNVNINKVIEKYPELAFQIFVGDYLNNIYWNNQSSVEFQVKNNNDKIKSLIIRFLFNNGTASQQVIALQNEYKNVVVPIEKPEAMQYALLPRPYPTFLPYWFSTSSLDNVDKIIKLESVQIAIPLLGDDVNVQDVIKIKQIKYNQ